jgi:hypothetical protein
MDDPAMQEWHSIRDAVIKDRWSRRDNGESGPRTMLYKEPLKDKHSRKDDGHS